MFESYLSVHTRAAQLVLDDHDDDAEHPHDERVVADPLAFLEQRLSAAQPVANIRFVFAPRSQVATGAQTASLADETAPQAPLLRVLGVLRVYPHQSDPRLLLTALPVPARPPLHRPGDRQCRDWLPELKQTNELISLCYRCSKNLEGVVEMVVSIGEVC